MTTNLRLYIERCRFYMGKNKKIKFRNEIKKHFNDTNDKPYKDAIEWLLKIGEWIRDGEGYLVMNPNKPTNLAYASLKEDNPIFQQQEWFDNMIKENPEISSAEIMGKGFELFNMKDIDKGGWIHEATGQDFGLVLLIGFLVMRAERNGTKITRQEVDRILKEIESGCKDAQKILEKVKEK